MFLRKIFIVLLLILLASCQNRKPKKFILGRVAQPEHNKVEVIPETGEDNKKEEEKTETVETVIKIEDEPIEQEDKKGVAEKVLTGEDDKKTTEPEDDKKEEGKKVKPFNAPQLANLTYTVQEGDHYYKIASMYGVAAEDLARINSATPATKLAVGQKITLPLSARLIPEGKRKKKYKKTVSTYDISKGENYRVKSGDYLYKIAKKNNTTVKAIMKVNNLSSDRLEVGQLLIIPGKTGSTSNKIDDEGESLFKPEPKPIKPEDSDKKSSDQTVKDSPVKKPLDTAGLDKMQDVLIVENDTLETLSLDFQTTPEAILKANPNIKSDDDLEPGMIIKVPQKD